MRFYNFNIPASTVRSGEDVTVSDKGAPTVLLEAFRSDGGHPRPLSRTGRPCSQRSGLSSST